INGYTWPQKRLVSDYKELKDDGSTACGVWTYSGVYPAEGTNRARSRRPDGPDGPGSHLGWGFASPGNFPTMYNRASADPEGRPWSEAKKLIWWDAEQRRWTDKAKPAFVPDDPPDYTPRRDCSHLSGMDALSGRDPFIMIADGRSSLFVPSGLKDAPLPA